MFEMSRLMNFILNKPFSGWIILTSFNNQITKELFMPGTINSLYRIVATVYIIVIARRLQSNCIQIWEINIMFLPVHQIGNKTLSNLMDKFNLSKKLMTLKQRLYEELILTNKIIKKTHPIIALRDPVISSFMKKENLQ